MMANLSCLRDLFNRERGVLYDLSSDAFQVLAGKGSRAVKIELMLTPHCYCAQQSVRRQVHLLGLLAVKPVLCFICRIYLNVFAFSCGSNRKSCWLLPTGISNLFIVGYFSWCALSS